MYLISVIKILGVFQLGSNKYKVFSRVTKH